jgi:aspartate/methionine/tyrosine aminotransferase
MDISQLQIKKNITGCLLWTEIKYFFNQLKFSPFGSSTVGIPEFHRTNLKKLADNLPAEDYQYNLYCEELIDSIYNNFKPIINVHFDKKEIFITPGAVKAIHLILTSFVDKETEEVILFQPFYSFHSTDLLIQEFKGLKIVKKNKDLTMDFDDLEKKINEKTKFVVFVNPDNPTTHIYSESELMRLTEILEKYPKIMVIEDMAYFAYLRNKQKNITPFYSLRNNREKTFMVFSGGKLFNITGIRCGWTIAPERFLNYLKPAMEMCFLFTSPTDSLVIAENLKSSLEEFKGCKNFYEWVIKDQNERFDYLIKILKELEIPFIEPEGTYYLCISVDKYRNSIPEKYFYTVCDKREHTKEVDKAFCRMIAEKNIGLLPLSSIQEDNEYRIENLVRISVNRKYEDLDFLINSFKELRIENII